jgi:ubiquinone/menaquinone biosynthesis C-methylase UbiE
MFEGSLSYWLLALIILGLLLVVKAANMHREMFENGEGQPTVTYEDEEIYDDFYASIYDTLFSTPERISFEKASLREIAFSDRPVAECKVLDACCGTAPHAKWICEEGIEYVGLDTSEAMLNRARKRCASARFYKGSATDLNAFPPKSFTHALLLYFSVYQFRNPKLLMDTMYQWLKPGSMLVVHLVDPHKFDPILDAASPFPAFSLQKYTTDRVIDSDVVFDSFHYKSRFVKDKEEEVAVFEEIIQKNGDDEIRENKHKLYMPSVERMIDIIRSAGFSRVEMVDMTPAGYEYQWLVYFTK